MEQQKHARTQVWPIATLLLGHFTAMLLLAAAVVL
jgi:hypothetical protein